MSVSLPFPLPPNIKYFFRREKRNFSILRVPVFNFNLTIIFSSKIYLKFYFLKASVTKAFDILIFDGGALDVGLIWILKLDFMHFRDIFDTLDVYLEGHGKFGNILLDVRKQVRKHPTYPKHPFGFWCIFLKSLQKAFLLTLV